MKETCLALMATPGHLYLVFIKLLISLWTSFSLWLLSRPVSLFIYNEAEKVTSFTWLAREANRKLQTAVGWRLAEVCCGH